MTISPQNWTITGAEVLGEAVFESRDLHLVDGCVSDRPADGARRLDGAGLMAAPGLIDLHGDGFERNLSPRPKVYFDVETALIETDRQLIANGITTAYLAMTVSWEPGLRSVETARTVVAALERLRPHLISDMRLQLRWELFALDAVDDIETWLHMSPRPTLAFNDHFSALFSGDDKVARKYAEYAKRSGLDLDAYQALTARMKAREGEVDAARARLAATARAIGVPLLAHDERLAETRGANRALGITISEFPLTRAAAEAATTEAEVTILGAPNVVRGGSHMGAMDAEPAIVDGLCTALASDYYYPAPLAAAARLLDRGDLDAAGVWSLVSGAPARATQLDDRGTLSHGKRGDVVLFRRNGPRARVEAVFVRGRLVFDGRTERA